MRFGKCSLLFFAVSNVRAQREGGTSFTVSSFKMRISAQIFGPLPPHARHGSEGASTPQPTGATGQGPCPYHATAIPSPRAPFVSTVRVHGYDLRSRAVHVLVLGTKLHISGRAIAVPSTATALVMATRGPACHSLPARPVKARPRVMPRPYLVLVY